MRLPLLGVIDLKTVVVTVLFLMFVLPWLLSMIGRRRNGQATS